MKTILLDDFNIKYEIVYTINKRIYFSYQEDILIIKLPQKFRHLNIENFIIEHKDIILKMIKKSLNRMIQSYENGASILLYGKQYRLIYSSHNQISIDAIYVKSDNPHNGYNLLAKKIGKEFYQQRINYFIRLANKNLIVNEICIRDMKTRYGVCNIRLKKITFNTELARYPLEIIDYIIVHELCHLIVPSHSKDFYQEIAQILPDYRRIQNRLKEIKL